MAKPGTKTPLPSGGSTAPFTVALPANASCTGDTASGGYLVYSYLVKPGTNLATLSYVTGPPTGTYGFVSPPHTYYGAVNTAVATKANGPGQIIGIPNDFEWAPLVTDFGVTLNQLLYGTGHTSGVWEAGILCAKNGTPTDNWNTEVSFTASSGDANGFVWSAVPGKTGISGRPTVTKVAPNTGSSAGGNSVTITGTRLNGART